MTTTQVPCPKCGIRSNTPVGARGFYCHGCKMAFEPEDDGTIGYGDPARNAERRERLSAQERQRRISEGMRLAWARKKQG